MVCCDEAPPHTGSLRQKFCEEKSVCLFSPFIVMLIIRNWRRCILVCMEFQVLPPPVTFHRQFIENGTKEGMLVFMRQ